MARPKSNNKRKAILEAAMEVFAERGISHAPTSSISSAAGVAEGTLFTYFKTKDELINELCHADFRALAQEFQKIARVADPIERLKRTGLTYIEFGIAFPNHYRLMFMTPHPPHSPEIEMTKGNPEEDAYAFLKVIVGECVARGIFRDEFNDVEAVSQLLWAGVHGVVSLRVAKGAEDWVDWRPVKQLAEMMIDMQLTGLLKDKKGA